MNPNQTKNIMKKFLIEVAHGDNNLPVLYRPIAKIVELNRFSLDIDEQHGE